MNQQTLKNFIKTWRGKSHNEGDQFASFVFIWICFNAWLEHLLPNAKTDRDLIKELKNRSNAVTSLIDSYNIAFAKKESTLKDRINHLIGTIKEKPIQQRNGKLVVIQSESDFSNVVETLYIIRCSLFHGNTDADDRLDQVLAHDARLILIEWIGELIVSWN